MKAPIRQVFLKACLFIVQFSTRCLKTLSWTFFMDAQNRCISGFCEISLKGSINLLFEHNDLAKVIAARLLTNFTFVVYRISEQKFLVIFCYAELLLPRHSESDRTLLSSRPTAQSVQENVLIKFSEKISQEYNCSDTKSK